MIRLALLLALLLEPALCRGATLDLGDYRWVQHPGAQVSPREVFRDDTGRAVRAGDLAQGRPLILALGYFHCPNLCGLARSTLLTALRVNGLDGSRDYTLAALSIDPHETTADSRAAKAADIVAFPLPGAKHWRYLTGDQQSIIALTNAVGYQSRFDPALKQFIHPTGLVVITAAGRVSSYLLGLSYQPGDLRVALAAAEHGTVRSAVLPVLLLCFHYDMTTGRYTLSILKLLKLFAALTLITVVGLGAFLFRRKGRA